MIKEILMAMVMTVTNAGDVDVTPKVSVQDLPGHQIAVHAHSKDNKTQWLLFDTKLIDKIDEQQQLELVVHEVAHMMVHLEHGKRKAKANKGHKSAYKAVCWDLADKVGVDRKAACSAEIY